jgi:hypothetical protein
LIIFKQRIANDGNELTSTKIESVAKDSLMQLLSHEYQDATSEWMFKEKCFKDSIIEAGVKVEYWRNKAKAIVTHKQKVINVISQYKDTIHAVDYLSDCMNLLGEQMALKDSCEQVITMEVEKNKYCSEQNAILFEQKEYAVEKCDSIQKELDKRPKREPKYISAIKWSGWALLLIKLIF